MKNSNLFIIMIILFATAITAVVMAVKWEDKNQIEVWVDYEVKILDKDHVIFYNACNMSDSLVFRLHSDIFLGTQGIQKLEYRLP